MNNKKEIPKLVQLIYALEEGKHVLKQITPPRITDSITQRGTYWELWLEVVNGERIVRSAGWRSAIDPACKPFCHMVSFPEEWEIVD